LALGALQLPPFMFGLLQPVTFGGELLEPEKEKSIE
jgi:hypothetical protein